MTIAEAAGQAAFEAYSESMGGLTHDGKPIPKWAELGDPVRGGWVAGAMAARLSGIGYEDGTWTIQVAGGPAFMVNVVSSLAVAAKEAADAGLVKRAEVLRRLADACVESSPE